MNDDQSDWREPRTLLIVDDDEVFRTQLARAMQRRGFTVTLADSIGAASEAVKAEAPNYAILDMRLGDGSGLELLDLVRGANPDARVIMLTGYGNIATAVRAMQAGAVDYLPKPADADTIYAALGPRTGALPPPPDNPMSADRVRWEHIQRVFEQCDRNVSETARRLNMHRRTLQRILAKHAPRE
jgi:two-component system, response regulator RegA